MSRVKSGRFPWHDVLVTICHMFRCLVSFKRVKEMNVLTFQIENVTSWSIWRMGSAGSFCWGGFEAVTCCTDSNFLP